MTQHQYPYLATPHPSQVSHVGVLSIFIKSLLQLNVVNVLSIWWTSAVVFTLEGPHVSTSSLVSLTCSFNCSRKLNQPSATGVISQMRMITRAHRLTFLHSLPDNVTVSSCLVFPARNTHLKPRPRTPGCSSKTEPAFLHVPCTCTSLAFVHAICPTWGTLPCILPFISGHPSRLRSNIAPSVHVEEEKEQ